MKAGVVEVRVGSVSDARELLRGKFDSSETTRGNDGRGCRSVPPNEETVEDHT